MSQPPKNAPMLYPFSEILNIKRSTFLCFRVLRSKRKPWSGGSSPYMRNRWAGRRVRPFFHNRISCVYNVFFYSHAAFTAFFQVFSSTSFSRLWTFPWCKWIPGGPTTASLSTVVPFQISLWFLRTKAFDKEGKEWFVMTEALKNQTISSNKIIPYLIYIQLSRN